MHELYSQHILWLDTHYSPNGVVVHNGYIVKSTRKLYLQGHVNVYTYTYSVKTLQDEEEHKKSLGMMNVYFWVSEITGR